MADLSLTKKERTRRENAALLKQAEKSVVCPRTGKTRCLSCGSSFGSLSALAAHLKKHDGVNSIDYHQAKIVGTSHILHTSDPVERPPKTFLGQLIETAAASKNSFTGNVATSKNGKSTARPTKNSLQDKNRPNIKESKKKIKPTPMKKTILIEQVLSIRQLLRELDKTLQSLYDRSTTCTDLCILSETKKEVRRVLGCINANRTKLDMALNAINQKFTFRQLVMIEYLTNQANVLTLSPESTTVTNVQINNIIAMDNDDNGQGLDSLGTTDQHLLDLYNEAETLEQSMEAKRMSEWNNQLNAEAKKLTKKRRDMETGMIIIKRPLFVSNASMYRSPPKNDAAVMVGDVNSQKSLPPAPQTLRMNAEINADKLEAKSDQEIDNNLISSSQDTSSNDDELWGFSDVLTQWAKQTQFNEPSSKAEPLSFFQHESLSIEGERSMTNATSAPNSSTISPTNTDIHIIHCKNTPKTATELESLGNENQLERESVGDSTSAGQSICLFIRPCFGVSGGNDANYGALPPKTLVGRMEAPTRCPPIAIETAPATENDPTSTPAGKTDPQSLDDAVYSLLTHLNSLQHKDMKENRAQPAPKWIVSGFSEVKKHISRGSVKLVIAATNIDLCIERDVAKLRCAAEQRQIPWIQALTRKKIGQIYHFRKRMSMIAVLRSEGQEDAVKNIISLSSPATG